MRIVYTSDLHGELEFYRAACEAAFAERADAIIFGGDLCPGTPSASAVDLPQSQPEFLRSKLAPLLAKWRRRQPGLRVFAIPGNDDCETILRVLDELEADGLMENLHGKAKTLGEYTLVGLAYVPPTPFSLKDFERRDSADDRLPAPTLACCVRGTERGFETITDFEAYLDSLPTLGQELDSLPVTQPARTVAVVHCPPYNTKCDVLFTGEHIGSKALRRWLERVQLLISLHGHIHESPKLTGAFCDRVGTTTVVNPGCDHTTPHLVIIDLEKSRELEHSLFGRQPV